MHTKSVEQYIDVSQNQNSIYCYLKDKRLRNSRRRESQTAVQKKQNIVEMLSIFHQNDSVHNNQYRCQKNIEHLQSKIRLMMEYTESLEQKIQLISKSFHLLYCNYEKNPASNNTVNAVSKCKQQFKQIIDRIQRRVNYEKQIAIQKDSLVDQIKMLIQAYEKRIKTEKEKTKEKIEKDFEKNQKELKSSLEALKYNNLILNKLQNHKNVNKVSAQLIEYQKLKKKHQTIVEENSRLKLKQQISKYNKSVSEF